MLSLTTLDSIIGFSGWKRVEYKSPFSSTFRYPIRSRRPTFWEEAGHFLLPSFHSSGTKAWILFLRATENGTPGFHPECLEAIIPLALSKSHILPHGDLIGNSLTPHFS